MTPSTRPNWLARIVFAGCAAIGASVALTAPLPAEARVWASFSAPYPVYYYPPGPYYGYAPAPYAYAPPADYYYPPSQYSAPAAYPAAPSAYTPPDYDPLASSAYAAPAPAPAVGTANRTPAAQPGITYTNKPAFTNAAGQTCRQYKTTDTSHPHPVDVYGTACRQADGQWRVVD